MATVLDSKIAKVTVFREGALVERVTKLKASTDLEKVRIAGLPACLQDGSVRVKIASTDPEKQAPIACDLKVTLEATERKAEPVAVDEIRAELKQIKRKQAELSAEQSHVQSSLSHVSSVTMPDRPTPEESEKAMPNPSDARLQLELFLADKRKALLERNQAIVEEQYELQQRKSHLKFKLNEQNKEVEVDPSEITKAVQLRLRSEHLDDGAESELKLEYLVPGARWFPCYSLHISGTPAVGELAMQAYVSQDTGEDWSGVEMSLSTANAQQWVGLPELHSKRIGRQQSLPPKKGWRKAPAGVELLYSDYDAFKQFVPTPPPAIFEETGYGDEFDLDDMLEGAFEEEEKECMMDECLAAPEPMDMEMAKCMSAPPAAVAEAMPPPAPAPATRMKMSKKRAAPRRSMSTLAGGGAPGGIGRMEPEVEEVAGVDDKFMQYYLLRMPAMDASVRGKLQVTTGSDSPYMRFLPGLIDRATMLAAPPIAWSPPQDYEGFDFAYACNTPVDVPSQNKSTMIPVMRQNLPLKQYYVAVPREGQEVFRVATITNPMDNPLQRGPVDIYLNGEFFVSTDLEFVAPRGKRDIGLGVEQSIKVARNTDYNEEGEGGLLGSSLKLHHQITVDIVNNLTLEAQIKVRERVPVKNEKDDDIEIKTHDVEPSWHEYDVTPVTRGCYEWDVKVAAGAKQTLKASYSIKISAKNEIVGGNRREA